MHASLQELASLRDRQPCDAVVAQHVAHCGECQIELQRLRQLRARLSALPDYAPPPDGWQSVQRQLTTAAPATPPALRRPRGAAALAAVLPLCALALFWFLRDSASHQEPSQDIAALVERSQQLESVLQMLPHRPAIERAGTSARISALQSRIQLLDSELSASQDAARQRGSAQRLWSERVQLMHSLIGMRYAEAVRVEYQTANNDGAM